MVSTLDRPNSLSLDERDHRLADLSTCDREPVQFPGAIMPHGVLLVMAFDDDRILGVSANAGTWFGRRAEHLLNGHLDQIVTADVQRHIERSLVHLTAPDPPRYLGCLRTRHNHVERQGGRLWLESTPGQGSSFFLPWVANLSGRRPLRRLDCLSANRRQPHE